MSTVIVLVSLLLALNRFYTLFQFLYIEMSMFTYYVYIYSNVYSTTYRRKARALTTSSQGYLASLMSNRTKQVRAPPTLERQNS